MKNLKKETRLSSLRNQDWRIVKAETEQHKQIIKQTNQCKSKISLRKKNLCSTKEHEQKFKTWMVDSTGNADQKSTTASKNDKTEKEHAKKKAIQQVKQTI